MELVQTGEAGAEIDDVERKVNVQDNCEQSIQPQKRERTSTIKNNDKKEEL